MSAIKQGQLNQIMFTIYAPTTGKQVSGVTVSQISAARQLWGVKHGGSAAAVNKAISKVPSLVRSGVFRLTLKSAEVSNFDEVLIHIEGNNSATIKPYNSLFEVDTFDDSDLLSLLTIVNSRALVIQSGASDAASAAQQANSRALVIQSMASDAASAAAQANSRTLVGQSFLSDIQSALTIVNSRVLVAQSGASDAASAAQQANSRALVIQSFASDIASAVLLVRSTASDAASAAQQAASKVTIANSQIILVKSMASDAASAAQQANSRALLTQSLASDAASAAAQVNSRLQARLPANLAKVTAVPGVTPTLNDAIMFLVHAQKYTTRRTATKVTIGKSDGSTLGSAVVSFSAATSTFQRGTFA